MSGARIGDRYYPELDNLHPCSFSINGIIYSSAENYFQCSKAKNPEDRENIRRSGPGEGCWNAGQALRDLRIDWETIKVYEMYNGNLIKYLQNPKLSRILFDSGHMPIQMLSSTSFWNKWNSLILERIRAELRHADDEDARRAAEIRTEMDRYAQNPR